MVTAREVVNKLQEEGWSLSLEGVEGVLEDRCQVSLYQATQELLCTDLKDVGLPCLPDSTQKSKTSILPSPLVLQVEKVKNLAAPQANQESGAAPRMLCLTLTDGSSSIHALEWQPIKALSLNTAPGTKVYLSTKVSAGGGYLLLKPNNMTVLGGTVQALYDKWKLSMSVARYARFMQCADGSGPPPWVPFGQHVTKNKEELHNFKSLTEPGSKEKNDDQFECQRKQVVKELVKDTSAKVFGGGKQMLDSDVQKVVNAGFSPDVAEWALVKNKNDPHKAIKELKAAAGNYSSSASQKQRDDRSFKDNNTRRGQGNRSGGRGRGKQGAGGPDGSDDDMESSRSIPRPSGPANLFDFLDSKIGGKKETAQHGEAYYTEGGNFHGHRGFRSNTHRSRAASSSGGSKSFPSLESDSWPAPGEEVETVSTHVENQDAMRKEHTTSRKFTPSQKSYRDEEHAGVNRSIPQRNTEHRFSGPRSSSSQTSGHAYYQRSQRTDERKPEYESGFVNHSNYSSGENDAYYSDNYHRPDRRGQGFRRGAGRYQRGFRGREQNIHNEWQGSCYPENAESWQGNLSEQYYGSHGKSYANSDQSPQLPSTHNQAPNYTVREQDLIHQFQQSMTLAGHYPPHGYGGVGQGYYQNTEWMDYGNFSGTLEFTRGPSSADRGSRRSYRGY